MIKYTMHSNNALIVGLGLSEANIQKLRENKPILVKLQELGITAPIEILIHWGETEHALAKDVVATFGKPEQLYGYDDKEDQP